MVLTRIALKLGCIACMLQFCTLISAQNDQIIPNEYRKTVKKAVKSEFGIKKASYEILDQRIYGTDLLRVKENGAFIYISEVKSCTLGGCTSADYTSKKDRNHEFFDLMIVLDAELVVRKVKVLDYYSDYGYEVTSGRFLKKFKGREICSFKSNQVDAISGATVSADAISMEVNQLCDILQEIKI